MNKSLQKTLAREFHPTYDVTRSYEWNYRRGPFFRGPYPPARSAPPNIPFLGFKLRSRLGVAAGPLLNSRWIRVYAKLGFDLLSYKTVRTRFRPSNPKPNCVLVETRGQLTDDRLGETLRAMTHPPAGLRDISITNSFGVPSRNPSVWQEDVERSKRYLDRGQVLIVSTMGSSETHPDAPSFIRDFARSAALAREAGADIVELDLSCPNSHAAEGMVYMDPGLSGAISKAAKALLGEVPLFIKLGNFWKRDAFEAVIRANASHVEGIVGINTVKMTVLDADGKPAVPGRPESGVCGAGIKQSGLQFARWLCETRKKNRYDFVAVGVGGIMKPEDVDEYLDAGVDAVEAATAAMWDPYLAHRYYLTRHGAP
ncbi:MAG TPA: dihydroorotate dehydrogenase [Nitrospiria bacterium]|nr:dihydroorotate dehydrogenase [Nitrospiria bacterium]